MYPMFVIHRKEVIYTCNVIDIECHQDIDVIKEWADKQLSDNPDLMEWLDCDSRVDYLNDVSDMI